MYALYTPVKKERDASVKEVLHVLMPMDVIQMILEFVVRFAFYLPVYSRVIVILK